MKPIVLIPNSNGKIELTKEELQKLLDDAYEQGKHDAPQFVPLWRDVTNIEPYCEPISITTIGTNKDYQIRFAKSS